ncbi:MAG: DUF1330 domain-containing protein [Myxococcota bacterium]
MAAYLHIHIDITDPERYGRYQALAKPTLAAHGARLLSKAVEPQMLEGTRSHAATVLLAFDDEDAAKRWYNSPEYAEAIEARRGAATFVVTLLPGA